MAPEAAGPAPALSVVLITPDSFDTIRAVVRCLARQTVHERIELLIVAPAAATIEYEESAVAPFESARVVSLPSVVPTGPARAAAIRAARAPVVAFAEEHCFPAPGWAEALLDAHREEYAGVGPAIRNANPDTIVSWADLLMGYGPWLAPAGAREMDFLPGHNSSYKRAVLLEYGDKLDELMEAETILQWDLRKRGKRLFLEPRAQAAHTNFGFWRSWIPVTFYNGRAFASTRTDGWPLAKRLGYVLASPAIPLVRLARSLRYARQSGRGLGFTLRVAPVLLGGLVADGAGQMLGYALGAGNAHQRMAAYEWHRLRHTPRGPGEGVDVSELGAFADARLVEVPAGTTLTHCRVAGARAARAPIVAFAEDHSFPMPKWAESLERAHASGFDAVAPSFHNGNPATTLSWADITLAFGSWVAPVPGGDVARLPWHNTSYKRELLLAFGDRLAEVLEVESVLQEELRARGHRLYLDTDSYTQHVNFSRLGPFVEEYYVSGRLFGGRRAQAQRWSLPRRAVYALGSPLIPVKRLPEVVRQLRRMGRGELLPRIVPALLVGLAAHSLGEMVGYALGSGHAGEQKSAREFDRGRFVVSSDLPTLAP